MKTITILKQGQYWSIYFTGFDFDDYVSPTLYSINMPAAKVIEKLKALSANNDVENWKIL